MNVIYTSRIGKYLKIFAGCLLLVGLAIKPGKSSAQTCTAPGVVTATSSNNVSCSSFLGNWNAPSGTVTNYLVELASDPGFVSIVFGPVETGSAATSFSFTGLNAGLSAGIHTYYMRVMAVDSVSSASICYSSNWSDTVITNLPSQSDTCQCTAQNDLTCATDYISNVSINTLNNSTGCSTGGYSYYFHSGANAQTTNLAIASTYSLTISTGGTNPGTFGAGVWFDFNQNGSLMDAGEFLPISSAITTGSTALKTVTIPVNATPGFTTMRVRYGLSETMVQADACTMLPNTVDGETEDYSVCLYVPTNISLLPQNTLTCVGSTPVLFLGANGSGLTYQWYTNTVNSSTGGTPIPGATNSNYTPLPPVTTTPGVYYYYCVLTNICGTTITTPSPLAASLTVNPLPIVDSITANPQLLCIGNPLTLIGYGSTGVGTPTYNWSGPNGYTSTTTSDTSIYTPISIAATGNYSLTVVYPGAGCSSNQVITPVVTVNDSPSVASVTAAPTLLCAGSVLTLISGATTGGGTASSYIWSGPNGFRDTTLTSTTTLTVTTTADSGVYNLVVTYPGNGCYSRPQSTAHVEVDTAAAAIMGNPAICYLGTTTFTNTTLGGTWTSGNVSVASINGTTGAVTTAGSSGGTTNIVYTVNNGCGTTISNVVLTVNPLPGTINGNVPVCNGLGICLSDSPSGGTWSSSNGNVSVIASTGCITGINAGTASIIYTLPTGCFTTATASVNPLPATISGNKGICLGFTTSLTDATPGGSWSSSNTSIGSVGTSGIVMGSAVGTAAITYTLPTGCIMTTVVTVNPNPVGITGTTVVCATQSTSLSDLTAGGAWSSGTTSQATVGTSGIVTGVSAGIPVITYSLPTGCIATTAVTVNPFSVITGSPVVCQGLTLALTDATSGGTWSSSNTAAATVGTNGLVNGLTLGTTSITYLIATTGCTTSLTVSVDPVPSGITGSLPVCAGNTVTLTDGTLGGTWSSSNTTVATVGGTTGIVSGSAGVLATTTVTITYTLPTGCNATNTVTVNPIPVAITGSHFVCFGSSTCLTDITVGGTWSTSNTNVATIGTGGCITTGTLSGTVVVTYSIPTGCNTSTVFTVNPLPANISGPNAVCSGSSVTLSDAGGGTWSSSSTTVTVNSTSGSVTGIVAGPATATITYTLPTGCVTNTIMTINPLPVAITGPLDAVCVGSNITLSDLAGSGTWSSTNTNASIGSTGIVTGANPGTATISYTISTGCAATQVVTVQPLPVAISGSPSLCLGLTSNLTDASTGGTWSSSNSSVASIGSSTGAVTANTLGSATITYTLATGCLTTLPVTVNSLPSSVSYVTVGQVCPGSNISLTDPSTGGTWTSSNTTVANVVAGTGVVTGVAGGTANITYTVGTGCYSTALVTVYPAPATISGAPNICLGSSSTLSDVSTPGTWTSSNTSVVAIGSTSGVITDFTTTGTSTISYTLSTGCATSLVVTVVAAVTPISSNDNVCTGVTTTLTDATTGGTWSSLSTTVSVNSTSGNVTGVAVSGTATITYTLGTCKAFTSFTVNPLPAGITGPNAVCVGLTIALTDVSPGGSWSGNNGDATVGSTGLVTGAAPGTWVATFTLPTGCLANYTVSVNPVPNAITGSGTVCSGATINLSDGITGGSWTSSNTIVAVVGSSSGAVTGQGVAPGTATISYILPTGCYATTVVSVIVAIPAISGTASNCPQFNISLSDGVTGGTWTSSNTGIATVGSTGTVVDVTPGTATITYSIGGICTVNKIVTFNNVPAIPGSPNINMCFGSTPALSDATGGGTWSSSNPLITIGSSSGIVSAAVTGTTTISYVLPGGCNTSSTLTVVNTLPNVLGTLTVCKGAATTLSDATGGGTWSSVSGTGSVVVGTSSGMVTGNTAGTATIVYKLGSGCTTSSVVTVNPLPALISGPGAMCQNVSITLSDATAGGTWSSSSLTITGTGSVITVSAAATGTGTITYTLPITGCAVQAAITVNQLPSPIVGPNSVCYLGGVLESDPTSGGTWNSSNESVVYVSAGATFGVSLGTASISYVLSSTGCAISKTVTVNPLPALISGVTTVCAGLTTALTDASTGGTWSSDNAVIGSVNTVSGLLIGMSAGTADITYTLPTGCTTDTIVTILQSPTPILGSPAICLGNSTTLSDTTSGGTWSSSNTSVASVGTGTGLVSSSELGTTTISYTIGTGCSATTNVSVNSFPASITGNANVCPGSTTSLSSSTPGGTWSSSNTSVATVNGSTGMVTGVSGGVINITYTTPAGCSVTTTLNVFNVVGAITSLTAEVCQGLTLDLADTTAGGTWSSSNTSVATVGSSTGIVTGVTLGSTVTTFTAPSGCFSTATISVINGLPAITGSTFAVCPGFSITLSDVSAGGIWSSSSANVSVAASTGVVTGVSAGTANITYSIGAGCTVTSVVTVNGQPIAGLKTICVASSTTLSDVESGGTWSTTSTSVLVGSSSGVVTGLVSAPAVISYSSPLGCIITATVTVLNYVPDFIATPSLLCQGQASNLIDAYTGGTWSSGNTAIATVGSSSGVLTGAGAGTAAITYSLGTGCSTSSIVSVNALSPVTGTAVVCRYSTTNLSDATAGGTWSGSNTNVTIGSASGIVSAISAGTSIVTYTMASGCAATVVVTVNPIAMISGVANICTPGSTSLSDSVAGGVWSAGVGAAIIGSTSGIVTATVNGTTLINYIMPTGCTATTVVDAVSSLPSLTGNTNDCIGVPSQLSDAITGGAWSSTNTGVATVDAASGLVTGQSAGSAVISYQLGATCFAAAVVSVNALPDPITGSVDVCVGLTNTLTDATTGGSWTSGNTSVATVAAGVVTGVSAGMTNITYATPAGCIATSVATVNALPTEIFGTANICAGSMTTLTDTTAGGSWSSVNTSVATIGSGSGIATGVIAGTSTIVYTLPTGCITTTMLNVVNSVNPISGASTMCIGTSVSLSDVLTGGEWTSNNTNTSVGTSSGVVTGAATGTSTIIYTLGAGCSTSVVVTVNAGPPAISGAPQVCYGFTTTLTDATPGGTWSVSNSNITIGASSGFIGSVNVGVDTITYTINTGCKTTTVFTVNALPTVYSVLPGGSYCAGGTGVDIVLNGSDTGVSYILYYGATPAGSHPGTGDTLDFGPETFAGTYTIKATNITTGCVSNMLDTATVSITPNVVPGVSISSTSGDTVCVGTYTTFNAMPVNGGTVPGYEWLVNGVSPGADSAHYSYVPANGDVVSVILTSNALCVLPDTAIASIVMTVNTIKTPSIAISIAPHDTLCAGTLAQFTAVDSFGGAAPVFTWYKNGIVAASGSMYTFTPYSPDNGDVIYCKMTSDYGCVTTDTATSGYIKIAVDSSLIPQIAMSASPGTIIRPGQSDTITATVTNAGATPTYQWFVNTTIIPGATTNTFVSDTLSNGDSVICVVLGSGECGLYSFNSAVITIDSTLNVQQVSAGNSNVILVPNPNNGSFTIKGILGTTQDEELNIEVTDVLGRVVYKDKIIATGGKINEQIRLSSGLSNGMYSLSMRAANEIKVFHLVIEQ